jgi:hypothetical protein
MSNDKIFNSDEVGPKQVRYVTPQSDAIFKESALPNNSTVLIENREQDQTIFSQMCAVILIFTIIVLALLKLKHAGYG